MRPAVASQAVSANFWSMQNATYTHRVSNCVDGSHCRPMISPMATYMNAAVSHVMAKSPRTTTMLETPLGGGACRRNRTNVVDFATIPNSSGTSHGPNDKPPKRTSCIAYTIQERFAGSRMPIKSATSPFKEKTTPFGVVFFSRKTRNHILVRLGWFDASGP